MRNSAGTSSGKGLKHFEYFLTVHPSGMVLADRKTRMDFEGFETWKLQYFGDHFQVRKLYRSRGRANKLHIDRQLSDAIEMKCNRTLAEIFHAAKHEAGHALLCYAFRFSPVRVIDVRVRVIPGGNLNELIKNRKLVSLRILEGSTSPDLLPQAFINTTVVQRFSSACQGLGGIVGCQGDESGAENDLIEVKTLVASMPELACNSEENLAVAARRLTDGLLILANEIIADPVVLPRHVALAETLFENEYPERTEIEKILDPITLPDYSGRIEEIGKKFNICGFQRDDEEGQILPKPGDYQRNPLKNDPTEYRIAQNERNSLSD
jgi:hypothetical protein